jgi:bifunctional DNA-binding transcriptional regulator/antitoxin component of YhaV-PrlF toxin-antitoxin module
MPRVSAKNQITLPVTVLQEAGLQSGDEVSVDVAGDGELRVRRATPGIGRAFGALTGAFPARYLESLDAEDARR